MLRKTLRQRRQSLNAITQKTAARRLCHTVSQTAFFRQARHLALYQAANGEIDPSGLLHLAQRLGKHCYLPVLHPLRQNTMLFVRVHSKSRFARNRWGIPEPKLCMSDVISARRLDLVLVPLVGFDRQGNRLGMGKGFYDRCFAFRQQPGKNRPALMGLAHDCQEVSEGITPSAWDIRMDVLATPDRFYPIRCSRL